MLDTAGYSKYRRSIQLDRYVDTYGYSIQLDTDTVGYSGIQYNGSAAKWLVDVD